jgi:hypothetical protein
VNIRAIVDQGAPTTAALATVGAVLLEAWARVNENTCPEDADALLTTGRDGGGQVVNSGGSPCRIVSPPPVSPAPDTTLPSCSA